MAQKIVMDQSEVEETIALLRHTEGILDETKQEINTLAVLIQEVGLQGISGDELADAMKIVLSNKVDNLQNDFAALANDLQTILEMVKRYNTL